MPFYFRLTLLLVVLLSISKPAFSQTDKFSEDQKALLKEALLTALVTEKNLPDYNSLSDKNNAILLDNMVSIDEQDKLLVYLTPEVLPDLGEVKLQLQTEAEIKNKIQKHDLLFIRFSQINQPDSDYGIVHLLGQWDLGKKSLKKGFKFKEAQGYTMLFKKENGAWKFQKVINRFPNLIEQKVDFSKF